jgi:hypothetical protein
MTYLKIFIAAVCLSGTLGLDCNGQGNRIVGHSHYRILDTTGFYLYSIDKLVQGEKIARPQTVYYFSKKEDDAVQELTLANLEQAFAANTGFRYRLEALFRSDKELIAFDKTLDMYKIKYLYRAAYTAPESF